MSLDTSEIRNSCPNCFKELSHDNRYFCNNADCGVIFYCRNKKCGAPLLLKWQLASGRCPVCLERLSFYSGDDWPMHGCQPGFCGYKEVDINPNMFFSNKFEFHKRFCDFGAPVACSDTVFVAGTIKENLNSNRDYELAVLALSSDLKSIQWSLCTKGDYIFPQYSSPAIWKNLLLVSTLTGKIRIFDIAHEGAPLASVRAYGRIYSGVIIHENLAFVATASPGSLACYKLSSDSDKSMQELWSRNLSGDVHSYPCVDHEQNRVIVFQKNGRGDVFDFYDNWIAGIQIPGVNQMRSTPIIKGDFVFVGTGGPATCGIFAYDRKNYQYAGFLDTHCPVHASPAAGNGRIYFPLTNRSILAISEDVFNGAIKEVGRIATTDQLYASPVVTRNTIVQGDMGGYVHFFDAGLASKRCQPAMTVDGSDMSNAIIYKSRVYITMQPNNEKNGAVMVFYDQKKGM